MDASVDKCLAFCQSLAMSGQKFSFTLSIGKDNFSFNNKELGSSSCTRKKKSPSQIRREQRRKTERSLKKAAEPTDKVVEATESEESGPIVKCADFHCSQCDLSFKAEEDLNAHIGDMHTGLILPTPEKERAPDKVADLVLTPIHGQRKENGTMSSPPSTLSVVSEAPASQLTWNTSPLDAPPAPRLCGLTLWSRGPKCEKTFNCENDWRCHAHEVHHLCMKVLKRDPPPCPHPGCLQN